MSCNRLFGEALQASLNERFNPNIIQEYAVGTQAYKDKQGTVDSIKKSTSKLGDIQVYNVPSSNLIKLDTSRLSGGDGVGEEIYNSVWKQLEGTPYKYTADPESLSAANSLKLPLNIARYLRKNPNSMVFDPELIRGLSDSLNSVVKEVETSFRYTFEKSKAKPITEMTDEELAKLGEVMGKDPSFRLGTRSLKELRNFARSGGLGPYSE
jgi:hypothetical protein